MLHLNAGYLFLACTCDILTPVEYPGCKEKMSQCNPRYIRYGVNGVIGFFLYKPCPDEQTSRMLACEDG